MGVPDREEWQPADPAARRRAIRLLLACALVGFAVLALVEDRQNAVVDWVLEEPESTADRLRVVGAAAGAVFTFPSAMVAFYMMRLARRIAVARRFPPPGAQPVRDTRILRDAAADRVALALRVLAALLLSVALAMPLLLWRLFASLALG